MEDYTSQLNNQIQHLDILLKKLDKSMDTNKISQEYGLCMSKRKNNYQYYLVDKNGKRMYIKGKDRMKARKIAQRDYDCAVKKVIEAQKNRIDRFITLYDPSEIEKVFENLSDGRKQLVEPIISPIEAFIEEWKEANPGGMNTFHEKGQYVTDNGEYVRSKSEKILADMFLKYNIPYQYEPMLTLSEQMCFFPDFAVLNVRTRKTYYWEHLGLISDAEYAVKNLRKLSVYEANGISVGKNLLISMESENMPFDINLIKQKISQYLL